MVPWQDATPCVNAFMSLSFCVSPIHVKYIEYKAADSGENDTFSGGYWQLSAWTYNGISARILANRMVNKTYATRITPIIAQKATNQKMTTI